MTPSARLSALLLGLIVGAVPARAQCTPAVQRLLDERKFDEARTANGPGTNDDKAMHCLGMIDVQRDRARDAVGEFEKAVKLNDRSSLHHLWLGNALGDLADSTSKIKLPFLARRVKSEFERAVELDPRSVDARHGLIQFYAQAPGIMGGSMDKARDQAREIEKLNATRGHIELANLYLREKKTAEAEQELIAGERESTDSTVGGATLAAFYLNQSRWPDAFAAYDRLQKHFPEDAGLHFQVGRAAAISGEQLERGEREMKTWLNAPPKGTSTLSISNGHWRLGQIHEKQGRKDVARADYNEALTLWPENPNAKRSLAAIK